MSRNIAQRRAEDFMGAQELRKKRKTRPRGGSAAARAR